jgi:hypothetical protein
LKIEEKQEFVGREIGSFVEQYILWEFDVEKALREEIEKMKENESTEATRISIQVKYISFVKID